jgi:cytochrome c peroxidase
LYASSTSHDHYAPVKIALAVLVVLGCAPEQTVATNTRRGRVPAVVDPIDNPTTAPKVELGRLLFHDPILSSDRKVACATCHGQIWGLSDGLQYSVGIDGIGPAGTGRHGPTHTRRNASTLWNAAYRTSLFWDGRAHTLEEQCVGPMNDPLELGRPPQEVARELVAFPEYARMFRLAFPNESQPVSASNVVRAIAAFERTLVSTYAPYDRYVDGDTGALEVRAVRGLALFRSLQCESCHTPPLFEREHYALSLAPPSERADTGRMEVTHAGQDRGKFVVATLRNVGETAPYFHNGTVATLPEAIALEAVGRPGGRVLTSDETNDLVAFLRGGLTDLHAQPERPDSVPSGLMVPADGYRIPR